MGWGELHQVNYASNLEDAVRHFLRIPTTNNRERMERALEDCDRARREHRL